MLLFLTSLGTLFCVTAVALVSAWFLLAKPLRHLESEMDNCVKLDIRQRPHRCKKWLNELVCIFRNLSRMKATLVECTKFVPLEVLLLLIPPPAPTHGPAIAPAHAQRPGLTPCPAQMPWP